MKKKFLVTIEDENISVDENKFGIGIWHYVGAIVVFILANSLSSWLLFGNYPERFSEIVKFLLGVDTLTLILAKMLVKYVKK
nr:hypothetical protein [Phascolarctobacterium succinatutens]